MKKRKILLSTTSIVVAMMTASFMVAAEDNPKREGWNVTEKVIDSVEKDSTFKLTAEYKDSKYVNLAWDREGEEKETGREYSVYSKVLDGVEGSCKEYYRPVPIEGTVNVLNIYPGIHKSGESDINTNKLEGWMREPALEKVVDQESDNYDMVADVEHGKKVKYKYIKNENGEILSNGGGILESQVTSDGGVTFIRDSDGYNKLKNVPKRDEKTGLYLTDTNEKYNLPKVNVKAVSIDEFEKMVDSYETEKNSKENLTEEEKEKLNPLKKHNKYIYDVIMLGSCDCNNDKVPSNNTVKLFEDFINDGGGFLAGHDTIGYILGIDKGLPMIRDMFKIKVSRIGYNTNCDVGYEGINYAIKGEKIRLKKRGMLTNYPWKIGDEGTKLDIPLSHSTNSYAYGDIWMDYGDLGEDAEIFACNAPVSKEIEEHANYYLTVNNNTAMIQTGHSVARLDTSPDEQKVLANTLCYLHQLTAEKTMKDYSVQDLTAPDEPAINYVNLQDKVNISINPVKDNGTRYSYVVKEHNLHTDKYVKSNASEITATSGVKSYLVYVDDNKDTDITNYIKSDKNKTYEKDKEKKVNKIDDNKDRNTENLTRMGIKVIEGEDINGDEIKSNLGEIKDNNYIKEAAMENKNCYVHVAAMDNNNNISKTTHEKVSFSNILDIEPEKDSVSKNQEVWTDVSLNNIKEDNRSFSLHNVSDILNQHIVINYDSKKLQYRGLCTVNRSFIVFDEFVDEANGTITLNIRCRNIPDLKRNYMLALNFDTIEAGEAEVSIKEGTISDMSKDHVLLPVQLGKCSIKIK